MYCCSLQYALLWIMNTKKSSENYLRQFFSIYLAWAIFLHLVILNFYVPKWNEVSDGIYYHVAWASLNIVAVVVIRAFIHSVDSFVRLMVFERVQTNIHIKKSPQLSVIKTLIMLINQNGIIYFIFRTEMFCFFLFFFLWYLTRCTKYCAQSWCLRSIWTQNHCVFCIS